MERGRHAHLTASLDYMARVWQADGTLVAMLASYTDAVVSAAWSPDGTRIVTASGDGTARILPVAMEHWIAAAVCRVERTLTDDEIRDFQVPLPLYLDAARLAQRQCPTRFPWDSPQ